MLYIFPQNEKENILDDFFLIMNGRHFEKHFFLINF